MKEIIYLRSYWLSKLEDQVNEKIQEGFVPSGDLVIDKEGYFIQAMVKF